MEDNGTEHRPSRAVVRTLYKRSPRRNVALMLYTGYLDGTGTREEICCSNVASDTFVDWQVRRTPDNGRTWSETTPMPEVNRQYEGGAVARITHAPAYCPPLGISLRIVMRRSWPGAVLYTFAGRDFDHPLRDHTFIVENEASEVLLKYEEGPDFDPENPLDPDYLDTNVAYHGTSCSWASDGTVYHPVTCRPGEVGHSMVRGGVILMTRDRTTGRWTPSNARFVAPDVSSRGLLEPESAVLRDGTILIVMRGSDTPVTPGRKWMCTSTDNGKTISAVDEFRYSDGGRFYSPSSIHRFIRSTKTGKLYWIANICAEPPRGNEPRYPLYIGEIDEEVIGPRRESLAIVDDRAEDESADLKLSNFSVLENVETLNFELYMCRVAPHGKHDRTAHVYEYVIDPAEI